MSSNSRASTDPEPITAADANVKTEYLKVVALRKEAEIRPGPRLANLESAHDSRYAINMAKRLSPADMAIMAQATELRERGLRMARAGADIDGAVLVAQSRQVYEQGHLCTEARLSAESFQLAAEAYINYAASDMQTARAQLLASIALCGHLRDEFGYPVALRRIHLARNVVRVTTKAGQSTDALRLAACLVRFIEGRTDQWPWLDLLLANPDPLTDDARHFLLDQVLAEVALILSTSNPQLPAALVSAHDCGLFEHSADPPQFSRTHAWLAARHASVTDWGCFLAPAATFFADPPGRYQVAWRELSLDLTNLGNQFSS